LVVVSQKADLATSHHKIDALARIGTIPDNIAETVDLVDSLSLNILQNCFECLEITMDIADDRSFHRWSPLFVHMVSSLTHH